MGCLCGRPISSVLDDPSVSVCAQVGDILFTSPQSLLQSYNVGGCARGLMYVREDRFYYESSCCDYLCCKSCQCCACCGKSFSVEDIAEVEFIENKSFRIEGERNTTLHLRPGLKLTVKPRSDQEINILVQMQSANEFASKLRNKIQSSCI